MPAIVPSDPDLRRFAVSRQDMVEWQLRARGLRDERVLQAMARVPRHEFVDAEYRDRAYEDHPIPIGEGQTISQPYIVGLILESLALKAPDRVLEIGTGSGYQTALLAELAVQVFSIERHKELADQAEARLAGLGYGNVTVVVGDGSLGLPSHTPFDAIVVSAAAPGIPAPLFEQLQEGGRMVIPVGPPHTQDLELVRKLEGRAVVTSLGACAFVPLIGEKGYKTGW